jgi:hypothetical protein
MLGGLTLAAAAACTPKSVLADPPEPLAGIDERIGALERRHNAYVGLFAVALDGGRSISHRGQEAFAMCAGQVRRGGTARHHQGRAGGPRHSGRHRQRRRHLAKAVGSPARWRLNPTTGCPTAATDLRSDNARIGPTSRAHIRSRSDSADVHFSRGHTCTRSGAPQHRPRTAATTWSGPLKPKSAGAPLRGEFRSIYSGHGGAKSNRGAVVPDSGRLLRGPGIDVFPVDRPQVAVEHLQELPRTAASREPLEPGDAFWP